MSLKCTCEACLKEAAWEAFGLESFLARKLRTHCSDMLFYREMRGFGFVQFINPEDASDAQYNLDRSVIAGREVTVKSPGKHLRRCGRRSVQGHVAPGVVADGLLLDTVADPAPGLHTEQEIGHALLTRDAALHMIAAGRHHHMSAGALGRSHLLHLLEGHPGHLPLLHGTDPILQGVQLQRIAMIAITLPPVQTDLRHPRTDRLLHGPLLHARLLHAQGTSSTISCAGAEFGLPAARW
eukprot:jgi/Chlat1/5140/Chrsp33S08968